MDLLELVEEPKTLKETVLQRKAVRDYIRAFGHELRDLRKASGLSQKEIAEAAQVPQPYVSRVERGHTTPLSMKAMLRILRVYSEL